MADNYYYPNSRGTSHPFAFSINHWLHFEAHELKVNLAHSGTSDDLLGTKYADIKILAPQNLQENNSQRYGNLTFDMLAAAMGPEGGVGGVLGELARKALPFMGQQAEALAKGTVKNPREQQFFEAPQFRSYSFSWDLAPTSASEVNEIKSIISIFRKFSYPSIMSPGSGEDGGGGLMATSYRPPAIWKVTHVGAEGGSTPEPMTSYGKIGHCVITDVNVNYQAAGVHAQMAGGNPAFVNLTVNMTEQKLQHREFFGGQ
ncbi:MAG TPA: hypothetical protein DF712_11225 [Balneola sp.]|nr:hypothetical protein [Balneola sp.]